MSSAAGTCRYYRLLVIKNSGFCEGDFFASRRGRPSAGSIELFALALSDFLKKKSLPRNSQARDLTESRDIYSN